MDRVNEVTKECFNALAQIRRADERAQPMPEMLHQRMRSFIDRAMSNGSSLGFSQQDVQDIGFALVALTDELVVSKGGQLREFWLGRLLQLQYFNTNVAGREFFQRLQNLRQDPGRVDVLRIYYMCLLFGFRGEYAVRGGEIQLASIVEDVGNILVRAGAIGDSPLSPHAARPQESLGGVRSHLPLIWISIAAVVLAIGLYVFLQFNVSNQAQQIVDRIERAESSMGGGSDSDSSGSGSSTE